MSQEDPKFAKGKWVFKQNNSVGMPVYQLEMPPTRITFKIGNDTHLYSSDCIPEKDKLPRIPEREGYNGKWIIPKDLSEDRTIIPVYTPIQFSLILWDCYGWRKVPFSIIDRCPRIPQARSRDGFVAKWDPNPLEPLELQNQEIKAIYEPVRITFVYDGLEDEQPFSGCIPPKLQEKPGYRRHWNIPLKAGNKHIRLEPTEYRIRFTLKARLGEKEIPIKFDVETPPNLPKIPIVKGKVGYWTPFDYTKPENQETSAEYRDIVIRFDMPDGTIIERSCNDGLKPESPDLEDYDWPDYQISDHDIELVPRRVIRFALFYVENTLEFCVPFTSDDKHFLDEFLSLRTVPRRKRKYGKWKEIEPYNSKITRYIADYSEPEPDLPREKTSFEWDVMEAATRLYHGSSVQLGGIEYNLLQTEYVAITGINSDNISRYRSLPLRQWLKREDIPVENNVQDYTIVKTRDKMVLKFDYGYFWIGHSDENDEAIDFLANYEIYFIPAAKRKRKVRGFEPYRLKDGFPLESKSDEEVQKVLNEMYPISRLIPSRFRPETEFTELNYSNLHKEVSGESLKRTMQKNQQIIDLFNAEVHPEYKFRITCPDPPCVEIIEYCGEKTEIEIPSKIYLGGSDDTIYTVDKIGPNAFANMINITVVIPDSVKSISETAFEGCVNLIKIVNNDKSMHQGQFINRIVKNDWNQEIDASKIDPMQQFIDALDECELQYLTAALDGEGLEDVPRQYKKSNIGKIVFPKRVPQ